jgi:hypothetical protein
MMAVFAHTGRKQAAMDPWGILRDRSGAVYVEFAVSATVLVLIVTFLLKIGLFLSERAATIRATSDVAEIADTVGDPPTADEADALFKAAMDISGRPDPIDYRLYVKRIDWDETGTPRLSWSLADGALDADEKIVVSGGSVSFPSPLALAPGDAAFVVEFFRAHDTLNVADILGSGPFYSYYVLKASNPPPLNP